VEPTVAAVVGHVGKVEHGRQSVAEVASKTTATRADKRSHGRQGVGVLAVAEGGDEVKIERVMPDVILNRTRCTRTASPIAFVIVGLSIGRRAIALGLARSLAGLGNDDGHPARANRAHDPK
jgi:hypothetical protein